MASTPEPLPGEAPATPRFARATGWLTLTLLALLLLGCILLNLGSGAVRIAPPEVASILLERVGIDTGVQVEAARGRFCSPSACPAWCWGCSSVPHSPSRAQPYRDSSATHWPIPV